MIVTALISCLLVATAPGLTGPYCRAVAAWHAHVPAVSTVRWCDGDEECERVLAFGGALYSGGSVRAIVVARERVPQALMHPDYWGQSRERELLLLLEHEVGHALGLEHAASGIMRPGWDVPVSEPGAVEFERLRQEVGQ